ncbi:MAG: porin family protein [Bacteroidales bacterium]
MKITNRFLILTIALFLSASSIAQDMRFGVFADPQLTWFTSDTRDFKPNGPVFGFNTGFSFDRYFAERYAFTTGASITNIGGNLLYTDDSYTLSTRDEEYDIPSETNLRIKGQYVNIPLGFKFKTNQIGYITIYAQLGINGYLKLKGFAWNEDLGINREVVKDKHMKFGFISYMFGGGIEYSLGGPSALQIGVTFSNGMTPAFDAGHGVISIGNLALRLGVVF